MNNPNPFVPKGSLLEQQNKRRTHMKVGVSIVLAVGVVGLMGMLIQGCKQKTPEESTGSSDTNPVPTAAESSTNTTPMDLSNQPPVMNTNTTVVTPPLPGTSTAQMTPSPIMTPAPITVPTTSMTPATPDAGGAEYVVAKNDTLGKIAKKNGVTLKALEAANPEVKPTKLKLGQKLVIPAGGKSSADLSAGTGAAPMTDSAGESYIVKSGDTLTKIAKAHHVKLKALQAANNLTTTKIKVGLKLKIPSKGELATAPTETMPAAPAADVSTMPAPPVPVVNSTPATSPSPVPAH